ncbi:MAG: hypothetical protein HOI13_01815 [Candidatus Thioglobus sp.]|jgi:hypothetical protein|nr:hypothetical protein [Candidatus Thioglobus sp.]MBT5783907.1 hypothetical protein [Candidatus Thioglobus sp.]MBT6655905.1 hypothetical protein [Candidatus Thioglobus sp.]
MYNRIYLVAILGMVAMLSASFVNADISIGTNKFFGNDKNSQGFVSATVKPSANSNNLVLALDSGLKQKIRGMDDASVNIDLGLDNLNSDSTNKLAPSIEYSLSVNF